MPHHVLLVEDNLDDAVLTRECLSSSRQDVMVDQVSNGKECVQFLSERSVDLILLDLNMPVMDGCEVLAAFQKKVELRKVPVVVLTTSKADSDVEAAYELGCNSYVVKPMDITDLQTVINDICHYWFDTATLPPRSTSTSS